MSKRISLTQGQFAIVDDEDYQELIKYKWCAHYSKIAKSFYVSRNDRSSGKKKTIRMHHQIMNTPKGMNTDHINHNTLDNRKCNLRVCTKSQNMMNHRRLSNNTSGVTGVCWDKRSQRWHSQIVVNKKGMHLGYYENKEDAINARKQAENKYFGEFAYNQWYNIKE